MNLSDQPEGQCELEYNLRLLRELPVFAGLAQELLRVMAYLCEREVFAQGQSILTVNEPAEGPVLLIRGTAGIEHGSRRVATVSEGMCVGGLALLGRFRWLYTLRAETEVECLLLPRRKLLPQFFAQPEALLNVAQGLIGGVVQWDQQRLERGGEVLGQGPGVL